MLRNIALVIAILVPLRGWLIWLFNLPPDYVYAITSIVYIAFCILLLLIYDLNTTPVPLRNILSLIRINTVFLCFYILVLFIFDEAVLGSVYSVIGLVFIIPLFMFSTKQLTMSVSIVGIGIVISIFYFNHLITGSSNIYETAINIQYIFRDSVDGNLTISEQFLSGGVLNNPHDAAAILTMFSVFFIVKAVTESNGSWVKNIFYYTIVFVYLFALFMTGSAANITVTFFSIFIIFIFIRPFIALSILVVGIFLLNSINIPEFVSNHPGFSFLLKYYSLINNPYIADESNIAGIFNGLYLDSFMQSSISFFTGFGATILEVPLIYSEVALLKTMIERGTIPSLLIWWVLLYPIFISKSLYKSFAISNINLTYKMRKKYIRLLFILNMPILSAFLTLLHYGGLLKITGMTAYSLLYVLSIKKLIESAGEFKRYRYQGYQYD